jgi:serine O-acetyltransferase
MKNKMEKDKCQVEIQVLRNYREDIPDIVGKLVDTCNRSDTFDHVSSEPIISKVAIIEIINQLQRILFPGYFVTSRLDRVNLPYYLGQETMSLFEELSHQVTFCIRHDCVRNDLPCTHCEERGREEAMKFIRELPNLRMLLAKDVRAAYEGDPAATSYDVGEMTMTSTAPAITNAIFNACGVRICNLPATAEKVKAALATLKK